MAVVYIPAYVEIEGRDIWATVARGKVQKSRRVRNAGALILRSKVSIGLVAVNVPPQSEPRVRIPLAY